jgi:hypothetical protein
MVSLAQYALLGSLIAGAAGALVLVTVTVKHVLRRRPEPGIEDMPEEPSPPHRVVRFADTAAVLCFAISAGLAVMGLMEQSRAIPPAVAATRDDGQIGERLEALERLVAEEREAQARTRALLDPQMWQERFARFERRFSALEERAAMLERRANRGLAAPAPTSPVAPSPSKHLTPPASPPRRGAAEPPASAPSATPPLDLTPRLPSPAELSSRPEASWPKETPVPALELARPRGASPEEPLLGEQLRREWETVRLQLRRGD